MRESLFRGKSEFTEQMVYGDLVRWPDGTCLILEEDPDNKNVKNKHYVDPETVGEFTGMPDKKGKKIFEDDILCFRDDPISDYGVVIFKDGKWGLQYLSGAVEWLDAGVTKDFEIVGNIHDKPEWWEEGAENA